MKTTETMKTTNEKHITLNEALCMLTRGEANDQAWRVIEEWIETYNIEIENMLILSASTEAAERVFDGWKIKQVMSFNPSKLQT